MRNVTRDRATLHSESAAIHRDTTTKSSRAAFVTGTGNGADLRGFSVVTGIHRRSGSFRRCSRRFTLVIPEGQIPPLTNSDDGILMVAGNGPAVQVQVDVTVDVDGGPVITASIRIVLPQNNTAILIHQVLEIGKASCPGGDGQGVDAQYQRNCRCKSAFAEKLMLHIKSSFLCTYSDAKDPAAGLA